MHFCCFFGFMGDLGFVNCADICMCVVNQQFELLEFVFDSVDVDLPYDEKLAGGPQAGRSDSPHPTSKGHGSDWSLFLIPCMLI